MRKPRTFLVSAAAVLVLAVGAGRLAAQADAQPGATFSPARIDEAVAKLNSPDWILQAEGMAVLAQGKVKQAVPTLKTILSGTAHPWVRGRALVALAGILGTGALDDALAAANHPAPELRAAAMEALAIAGSPRALAVVESHLEDKAASVCQEAFVSLARLQKEKAWDRVAPLTTSPDPATVRQAARALVYVGTPMARKELTGLLAHKDNGVRSAAARALQQLRAPDAIPVLLKHMASDGAEDVKAACERALVAYEPEALAAPLLAALNSEDTLLYQPVLRVLAARPSRGARAGIISFLEDPPDRYKGLLGAALELAAGADPEEHRELFIRYLEHPEPALRRKAVEILARCPGADHFGLFRERLADPSREVLVATLRALRKARQESPAGGIVDYVSGVIEHPSSEVFEEAMGLVAERLRAPELPKALSALDPVFASRDDRRRARAAAVLEPLASDESCRKVAAAQGYLTQWKVIGPFPNEDRRGEAAVYPPELEVDFARTYEAYRLGYGAVFKNAGGPRAIAGADRESLVIRPPVAEGVAGRTVATYVLDLPQAKDLRLTMFVACQSEGQQGEAVRLEVDVDGKKVLDRKVLVRDEFQPLEVSLAPYAGKRALFDLVVEALPGGKDEWAVLAEPRVVSDEGVVADLVKLAPTAAVRAVTPGPPPPKLAWEPVKTVRAAGLVDLREILAAGDRQVAYAAAEIESPADRKVALAVAADDGAKVWLNGVLVTDKPVKGTGRIEADLRKGRNRLLLKIFNDSDKWYYSVRVTEKDGRRAEGLAEAR